MKDTDEGMMKGTGPETMKGTQKDTKTPLAEFKPTVVVTKVTDVEFLKDIIGFVLDKESTMSLEKAYRTRHSPMRTQFFLVKMTVLSEVSSHFVRHAAAGQFHYVSSNREDWAEVDPAEVNRLTPVRHVMIVNAEHLTQMAEARLCTKALKTTRQTMEAILLEVLKLDKALADRMRPKCFRQGGVCYEDSPCGIHLIMLREIVEQVPEHIYRAWRNDYLVRNPQLIGK